MTDRDPIADPLTPFWRHKVELAFQGGLSAPISGLAPNLTALQRAVMTDLAVGYDHAQVAERCGLSLRTVQQIEGRAKSRTRQIERYKAISPPRLVAP